MQYATMLVYTMGAWTGKHRLDLDIATARIARRGGCSVVS